MSHSAITHIGNDFNIGVVVKWEARVRGNLIVVQHIEISDWAVRRISIGTNGKVMFCVQPAFIQTTNLVARSQF